LVTVHATSVGTTFVSPVGLERADVSSGVGVGRVSVSVVDDAPLNVASGTRMATAGGSGVWGAVSLVLRPSSTVEVTRFHYPGVGDVSSLTSNATGVVTAEVVGLPGGNLLTVSTAGWVWAVMNTPGSTQATRTGATVVLHTWDPYGQPVSPAPAGPYGWLGEHQRHRSVGTVITQMGARPYHPGLGRFLAVDPVEGGCANDYAYPWEPINSYDLDGLRCANGKALMYFVYRGDDVIYVGITNDIRRRQLEHRRATGRSVWNLVEQSGCVSRATALSLEANEVELRGRIRDRVGRPQGGNLENVIRPIARVASSILLRAHPVLLFPIPSAMFRRASEAQVA
jgi:RHS repeat-associated protein